MFSELKPTFSNCLRDYLKYLLSNTETNAICVDLKLIGIQPMAEMLSTYILYEQVNNRVQQYKGEWEENILQDLRQWVSSEISSKMNLISVSNDLDVNNWNQKFDYFVCKKFCEMRLVHDHALFK